MAKQFRGGGSTFVDSPEKLEKLLKTKAKGFVTGVAQAAARELKTNVNEFIYGGYTPTSYVRIKNDTYGNILDAVVGPGFNGGEPTTAHGDGFIAYAGYDIDKMGMVSSHTVDNWGHHVNNFDDDARMAVLEGFEENGIFLPKRNHTQGRRIRPPVHVLKITEQSIERALKRVNERTYDIDESLDEFVQGLGLSIYSEN